MVFEFAIDPEFVAMCGDENTYRYFYEKFGIGQPRIMAEYPKLKNWRRKVLKIAPKDGIELQRVTALIQILSESMITRNTRNYDGNIEWLENAEKENSILPFHAILATSNPRNNTSVLIAQTLGLSQNLKWDISEQLPDVPRKASDMAKAIRSILRNCRTAVFIDPYFMVKNKGKWKFPLLTFFREFPTERNELSELRIEVHSSADSPNAPSAEYFEKQCTDELEDGIPMGLRVRFKRLKQKPGGKKLHDRYLITDIGGVDFSKGLDEGQEGDTQKISLLKKNTYKTVWEDYMNSQSAFDLEHEFIIRGRGKVR